MRIYDRLWAPDDRTSRGSKDASPPGSGADATPKEKKPGASSDLAPAAPSEEAGRRISGPGSNNLTRGLP